MLTKTASDSLSLNEITFTQISNFLLNPLCSKQDADGSSVLGVVEERGQ